MARKFVLQRRAQVAVDVDFERDLNAQQLAAVTSGEGPKLVIAGAGTGKTRTLTYRVAWLIAQGLSPDEILLVTFTNKAAREMVERVRRLTGLETQRLWGGTFHSIGARILRAHASRFGYSAAFSILDESDQRDLLRLCIADVGVEVERRRFPSPRVLASLISLSENSGVPASDLLADRYARFIDWEDEILAVVGRYAERKRTANAMDYDDLLTLWLRLLLEAPEVRRRYGQQLKYILVDEYQDTNRVQGAIVEALASDNGGNLMVVGDDCQSIYAFRGAHYDNILRFPERNRDTEIFKLEINYRSTPEILALTNATIRANPEQYTKELAARRADGPLPALIPCNYPEQEAAFVAERILQLRDEGTPLRHVAVLYRAHAHRLTVETTLLRYDIPYEVRGGVRFFEQAHIKDVTSHLRVVANPQDEVAFRRALLLQRGIGNATASRLWALVVGAATSTDLLARLERNDLVAIVPARGRPGWGRFTDLLREVVEYDAEPESAVRSIVEGYRELAETQFTNFESRLEDLEQLAIFAAQYDSIEAFLEELVLLGEMYGQEVRGGGGDDDEAVVLSTIHQAKGLEWDVVFMVHLVEGALPSPRGIDDPDGESEERRIFYVGMTRARDELYLSYPIVRRGGYGGSLVQRPSRFLQEIPTELMEPWEIFDPEIAASAPTATASPRRAVVPSVDDYDPNVDPVYDEDESV